MRAALPLLLLTVIALAQDLPVMRGVLVRRDAGVKAGELTMRTADGRVIRYRFDPQTYIERENRSIDAAGLRPGDPVEVVSEALPGGSARAARSIHVLLPAPPLQYFPALSSRGKVAEIEKGDLTFSGKVVRVSASRLVLHPREGEDQEIVLRPDTRYDNNGLIVALDSVKNNMRVFVRGARNGAGEIEAYQVVWGSMLAPK